MRTNNECIRAILKKIEMISYNEVLTVSKLSEMLPEFSIEDVIAMVSLLNRERYIFIADKAGYDDSDVFRENKIKCLLEKTPIKLELSKEIIKNFHTQTYIFLNNIFNILYPV